MREGKNGSNFALAIGKTAEWPTGLREDIDMMPQEKNRDMTSLISTEIRRSRETRQSRVSVEDSEEFDKRKGPDRHKN